MRIFNVKHDDKATSAETKLAQHLLDAAGPTPGTRIIVIASTRVDSRGRAGMAFTGYRDDELPQLLTDLLVYAQVVAQHCGVELAIGNADEDAREHAAELLKKGGAP